MQFLSYFNIMRKMLRERAKKIFFLFELVIKSTETFSLKTLKLDANLIWFSETGFIC